MREFGPRFGITGHTIESELFGDTHKVESEKKESGHESYLSYHSAMREVRNLQGESDPTDPDPSFANDLHATIAEEFSPEAYEHVRFYTAIGSILDKKHGVDGFIECDIDGQTIIVTLDVTANPQKAEGYKADVIILVPSDGIDKQVDAEEYQDVLTTAAKDIIQHIKSVIASKKKG